MDEINLKNQINEFCKRKNIEHPFIQECVTEFIEEHTALFGDIIPVESLMERLEANLNSIKFVGQEKTSSFELGQYKGRVDDNTDLNEIIIYFDLSDLELKEFDKKFWDLLTNSNKQALQEEFEAKRALIKSTLKHELVHCAYTIKDKYGFGEKHIFSETGKNLFNGSYALVGGHYNMMEAVVNYISSRIENKTPEDLVTYRDETKAIYMLAEKMDERYIVKSAWVSDEQKFKQAYIKNLSTNLEDGERSYNNFQKIMKKLCVIRGQDIKLAEYLKKTKELLDTMQRLLNGENIENTQNKLKELKKIKFEDISLGV